MKRFSLIILINAALFHSDSTRADFAMLPAPAAASEPTQTAPAVVAPTPPPAAQAEPAALHPAAPEGHTDPKPGQHAPQIALGFGKQIPLSFAVRQIVPRTVTLRFSRAADRDALVDWRGGRGWPSVLRDAIHPLGLRLSVRHHKAIIFKSQND